MKGGFSGFHVIGPVTARAPSVAKLTRPGNSPGSRALSVIVILEWTFSPPGYFEEPVHMTREAYGMTIADGKVEARVDSSVFDTDSSIRQSLHEALNDRFLGVQLLLRRPANSARS